MKTSSCRGLRRHRPAAALVAGLALAAGLSACGSDGGDDTATDPAGSTSTPSDTPSETPSDTPSESPTSEVPESGSGSSGPIEAIGSAGVTEAQLVSQTDAGGTASEMAFAVDTEQAIGDFVSISGLESGFADTVTSLITETTSANPGSTTYANVAAVGCEPPRSVAIDAGEAGFTVLPKLPKSTIQCLAPVTYVVVFAAPNA